MTSLYDISDEELVAAIGTLSGRERCDTSSLVAHLAEMQRRGLHHALGFRSLYGYCRAILHLSEHESYNRMEGAKVALRFPVVLPMLADGLLHLTAVSLLGQHLRDENHLALLGGSIHKSKREIEALLAGWFPKAEETQSIRKMKTSRSGVTPVAAERYQVQFTASQAMINRLRAAQELLSHSLPSGDLAEIFDRALVALLEKSARRKPVARSATSVARPRPARTQAPASRNVPASVEREVWARDGGRCAFVGKSGLRCQERQFIQFHHVKPWIVGGPPTAANIALRCRTHNAYEAAVYFAPIRAAREEARAS